MKNVGRKLKLGASWVFSSGMKVALDISESKNPTFFSVTLMQSDNILLRPCQIRD